MQVCQNPQPALHANVSNFDESMNCVVHRDMQGVHSFCRAAPLRNVTLVSNDCENRRSMQDVEWIEANESCTTRLT